MSKRLLIANRGEIACRIKRTAQQLGWQVLVVYSDSERQARHLHGADYQVSLSRYSQARGSAAYLDINALITIAEQQHIHAIHPGYGFLSENAEFARRCQQAGIVFIGPSSEAIEQMGNKLAAKQLVEPLSIPLLPGYQGSDQSDKALQQAASQVGYPLLIKAAAGGGGRGMRVVENHTQLQASIDAARREAHHHFGNDQLLLERFLRRPRHIEVQLLGDQHGHAITLFDRDCSIQRRHQKVVEEAPAPNLSDTLRQAMADASITLAHAIKYVGAGTVEYLVEGDQFYFMEMNTRLQVEHPVTEAISGLDLVEWQLRIADGEKLPWQQGDLQSHGHAVEVRLCAEDPYLDHRPTFGTVECYREPDSIRCDSGIQAGDHIGHDFDPMIAKLIAHGDQRQQAIAQLQQGLNQWCCAPLLSNQGLLADILRHHQFAKAELSNQFLNEHRDLYQADAVNHRLAVLAALSCLQSQPLSPWQQRDGWRLGGSSQQTLFLQLNRHPLQLRCEWRQHGLCITDQSGQSSDVEHLQLQPLEDNHADNCAYINGQLNHWQWFRQTQTLWLLENGHCHVIHLAASSEQQGESNRDNPEQAPIDGVVTSLLVEPGQTVAESTPLLAIEAMKMEYLIKSNRSGEVQQFLVGEGDQVSGGQRLFQFSDP